MADVSIVIPVYNDPPGIKRTLKSLSNLYVDTIVVDNGSSDSTVRAIEECQERYGGIEIYEELDVQSSYAARNRGIKNTESELLVFLDADEIVSEDYLDSAIEYLSSLNADYLGCNVELTLPEDTLVGRYNAHTGFPVKQYLDEDHYAPTCALLVRSEVFEDVGLFDARLISGGDREFGERVHEAGYKQGYAEDATVYHPARTSFESLAKKNFRVGRGFCQKQRYYPERFGNPGIPPKPSGSGGGSSTGVDDDGEKQNDEYAPRSVFERVAFAVLSVAMLACRGAGYYYEFFFGEERDDIPAPTS